MSFRLFHLPDFHRSKIVSRALGVHRGRTSLGQGVPAQLSRDCRKGGCPIPALCALLQAAS